MVGLGFGFGCLISYVLLSEHLMRGHRSGFWGMALDLVFILAFFSLIMNLLLTLCVEVLPRTAMSMHIFKLLTEHWKNKGKRVNLHVKDFTEKAWTM